ncbi:ABC transporter permease, partial [Bacteroidota bacterium]
MHLLMWLEYLYAGDKIILFSLKNNKLPTIQNPPALKQFIVNGIYESGMAEYDDINVYIPIETAEILFDVKDKISGYNILLSNTSKADSLANILQESLSYPYYVRTIFKQHQNIFTWINLQKKPIPIILSMIILVAVFNIIGTILMIILEKVEAIGILKSLGSS